MSVFEDEALEAAMLDVGFVPREIPSEIVVRGLAHPLTLTEDEHVSLMRARFRLRRWLGSQVKLDTFRGLVYKAKYAFLSDEFNRCDQEAIRSLYSDPGFRERIMQSRKRSASAEGVA